MTTRFGYAAVLGVAVLALGAPAASAWFWDEPPEATPPPVHVYDYARGPVWTSNGWAYVPVEVHFPRSRPPVLAMPPPPYGPIGHRRGPTYAPDPLPRSPSPMK